MQLVPMLELRMSKQSSHLPNTATLQTYTITVQPLPNDQLQVLVPLQLTTDDKTEQHVAFYGKMLYQPGNSGWGDAHQVRLVWAIQELVDVCETFKDGQCDTYRQLNVPQVIHTYYDPFALTGLNVREDHGSDIATVYEDPNPAVNADPNNDAQLWPLAYGLDQTFL